MTAQEKERITRLRGEGKSYGAIATLLGISASKVKSYCIRHELGGARSSVGRRTAQGGCESLSSRYPGANTSASAQMPAECNGGQRTGTS